ncbi:MAG: two-component regulator propeller domain-containing protein [Candidatus Latescibacterota bacterium]
MDRSLRLGSFVLMLASVVVWAVLLFPIAVCSQNAEWMQFSSAGGEVLCIEDGGDCLWIGKDAGLVQLDVTTGEMVLYNTSNSALPNDRINALAVDTIGRLWIGTRGGLAQFDGLQWTVYTTGNSGLASNDIRALAVGAKGELWISGGGLARFDGEHWTVYTVDNLGLPYYWVSTLAVSENGELWIGMGSDGLARFDGEDWIYKGDRGDRTVLSALASDMRGNIWLGMYPYCDPMRCDVDNRGGLTQFGEEDFMIDEDWMIYRMDNSSLPSNWVNALALDARGNLWIGTRDGGLVVYREGGVILTTVEETPRAELPSNYSLSQNYPNPFNAGTDISFSVSTSSLLKIAVYTVLGQLVRELADQTYEPGVHHVRWDGTDRSNRPVSSGVYLYRMKTDTGAATATESVARKMMLLR